MRLRVYQFLAVVSVVILGASDGVRATVQAQADPRLGAVLIGNVLDLDSGARIEGAVVALRRELSVPIRFLGTGESAGDLEVFDPRRFAEELVAADEA